MTAAKKKTTKKPETDEMGGALQGSTTVQGEAGPAQEPTKVPAHLQELLYWAGTHFADGNGQLSDEGVEKLLKAFALLGHDDWAHADITGAFANQKAAAA